ncbi:MAG: hypothetical protein A2X49_08705 [Lentisphaerae bacterium GWF2_52_8]|nr:MAG: hypothetical protein A2X49_08705 [Lentisphaerae bacterium GWF2_52_8]
MKTLPKHALELAVMALAPHLRGAGLTPEDLQKALDTIRAKPVHSHPSLEMEDRLITPKEAAKLIGVSRRTIDSYAAEGRLTKIRLSHGGQAFVHGCLKEVGGAVRFRVSEVKKLMDGVPK